MVISFTLVNNLHHWLVIKWFLPCSTSRHCNHMVRFISLWVRLEDPGLSYIFTQWSLFLVILHGSNLYWSWLCYHLIMDLRLCLVAVIVLSRSLLPWICIVLVGSHVMSHLIFELVVLYHLPTNILSFYFFTLQSIHLSHSSNFMLWGAFCYTKIISSWSMC